MECFACNQVPYFDPATGLVDASCILRPSRTEAAEEAPLTGIDLLPPGKTGFFAPFPNLSSPRILSPGVGGSSIEPVFDAQSWDWREVGNVAREQGRFVGEADASDFQILSADFLAQEFQPIEAICGGVIPREHKP